jgi:D-3-phosphoglycerate dehydrogenase
MNANPHNFLILNAEPDQFCNQAKIILQSICTLVDAYGYDDLHKKIKNANGLVTRLGYRIDNNFLNLAPNLRLVGTATTGLNHIDVEECKRRGVEVISLAGERDFLNTITATAEHTWGLLLALIRYTPGYIQDVQSHNWNRDKYIGRELDGMTIGIIGLGRLGCIVAKYAVAFGMKVVAYDTNPNINIPNLVRLVSLSELFSISDVITIHAKLHTRNINMIGKNEFNQMKDSCLLINTARGELIDEDALLAALEKKKIAGAALDVLSYEVETGKKLSKTHRLISYSLNNKNLIITPHIGGATVDSMRKTEVFLAKKIVQSICNGGYD